MYSKTTAKESPHKLLSRRETSDLLGINLRSLDRWRVEGKGPAFHDLTLGQARKPCIRYRMSDLEEFLSKARISPVFAFD